jgi:glycosyltransferase involved in cell wall biosynthesis
MTLWVLDDGLILGGGQLFALRLAACAEEPVRLVCPAGSPVWERARAAGIPCADVAFPAPAPGQARALGRAMRRLRAVLAAAEPGDILVSNGIRCSLVAAPALAGRRGAPPLVHLLHERDSAERRSVRAALRRSRRVVAIGAGAATAYRAALPGARVVQANNFLAPAAVEALSAAAAARAPRPDGAPPRLGVLARIIPEKGVAELVDELAATPAAWDTLAVAGALQDAGEVERVRARIAARGLEGRAALTGPTDDVAAFLGAVDALVVPSVGHEGQPTTILEGLAAGLPVLAREPMVSTDFADLAVLAYRGAADLGAALAALPAPGAPPAALLAQRFACGQVVAALREAAS